MSGTNPGYPIPNPNVTPPFPSAEPAAWTYAFNETTQRSTATYNGDVVITGGGGGGLPPVPPGIPSTLPTDWFLNSAGTWTVPGSNAKNVSGAYTALPTDDFLWFTFSGGTSGSLTLPGPDTVPEGKILRVAVWGLQQG